MRSQDAPKRRDLRPFKKGWRSAASKSADLIINEMHYAYAEIKQNQQQIRNKYIAMHLLNKSISQYNTIKLSTGGAKRDPPPKPWALHLQGEPSSSQPKG